MTTQELAQTVIDGAATDIRALRSVYTSAIRQQVDGGLDYTSLLAVAEALGEALHHLNEARSRV